MSAQIKVYFTDGSTYSYQVRDAQTAKRYAHSITTKGFRKPKADGWTYYPITEIKCVEVTDEGGKEPVERLTEER